MYKAFKKLLFLSILMLLLALRSSVAQLQPLSISRSIQANGGTKRSSTGEQFCYVRHRSTDFFKDYPLNSAFEAVHVYPEPRGVGEGQSAYVFLEAKDLDYIRKLNGGNSDIINWMTREENGSLYRSAQPGDVTTRAQWFPILLSGNIVKITEVVGQRGKVEGLDTTTPNTGSINRETAPYFIHWVSVIWRDGRITDTPKGPGLMPVYDPAAFRSKAITDMWVNIDELICPIDLAKAFVTTIDPSLTEGVDLHSSLQLGNDNLLGSKWNHTQLYPPQMGGEPFHVWQVTQDGNITWGLTDWGYLVLKDGMKYNVAWRGG